MDVILLAAGYATRLYPLTKDRPKPLLPVAGKAILDHILDKIKPLPDVGTVYCVTNHRFSGHFERWAAGRRDFTIRVVDDGTSTNETRLGAVGDIDFLLKQEDVDDDCLVLGGDNLFDFGLSGFVEFAGKRRPAISIGAYDCKDLEAAKQFGLVRTGPDGRIEEFQEKPARPGSTLVAMCLYFFPRSTLERIPVYMNSGENRDAPGHYIQWSAGRGPVYAYVFDQTWFDIGNLAAYEEANRRFGR